MIAALLDFQGYAWSIYIFLAQSDRAGQACEAPGASSILAEDTLTSDSSINRAAGYEPAMRLQALFRKSFRAE